MDFTVQNATSLYFSRICYNLFTITCDVATAVFMGNSPAVGVNWLIALLKIEYHH